MATTEQLSTPRTLTPPLRAPEAPRAPQDEPATERGAPATIRRLLDRLLDRVPVGNRVVSIGVVCAAAALVIAVAVYGISSRLPASYQSSATFRVTVPNQFGVTDAVVTAANDLASQYAQLATAGQVVDAAASSLGIAPRALSGRVTSETVNATNIVKVDVNASSPAAAQQRATAVMQSLVAYEQSIDSQGAADYVNNVNRYLAPINRALGKVGARQALAKTDAQRQANATLSASLLAQRQQVIASLAHDAAAGQPTLQPVSMAVSASKVSPRPSLYAAIALIIAALISARIVYLAANGAKRVGG